MTNNFDDSNNLLFDFEALAVESLPLELEQIEQAVELSKQIINEQKQWQTYLHALALFAFESWLHSRAPELMINSNNCSIWQPSYANVIEGVFNLEVSQFKLCLLVRGTMADELVSIPRAVVDLAKYTAHFYVLVNIQEEQEEANIESFISYDKLQEHIRSANLQPQTDWTYDLSWSWFNREPDNLLLYLRCLEPSAIDAFTPSVNALPTLKTQKLTNLDTIQAQLEPLIPQLQNSEIPLWQILNWEKAVPLLSNPELLDWLYRLQTGTISATQKTVTLTQKLAETGEKLTQKVINVGSWLQNEIDEFAESLAWNLLPAPAFAISSMRFKPVNQKQSPIEEMEVIVSQLRNSGMDIPVEARGAYQDFSLGTNPLRLYVVVWAMVEQADVSEWSLLVILGAQPEHQLPEGLRLQLKEEDNLLDEKIVEANAHDTYLYSRVIGEWDEQFSLTIILASGETLVLPPFSYGS